MSQKTNRILLVDPKAPSFGQNIALALLGARLKNAGMEVKLLDQNNRPVKSTDDDLKHFVLDFNPEIVGFSVLYLTQNEVISRIRHLKEYYNGKIIVGGPQVTLLKGQIFEAVPEIDAAFLGEAEKSLLLYCNKVFAGEGIEDVPGILYRDNGIISGNPEPTRPEPIDNDLIPDFSLYGLKSIRKYSLLTSRGCPYACTYCFRTHSRNWRSRAPESIVRELKHAISNYGIEEVWIHDDSFNINEERVEGICRLWKDNFPDLPWACAGIRADHVTESMAKAMREAGCTSVGVGVESLNEKVFNTLDKRESLSQVVQGVKFLQEAGIDVRANFIIGLPGDTYKTTMGTFVQARKLGIKHQSWTLLMPIPGTEMFNMIYDTPGVKELNSYLDIDMIWMPDLPEVKSAFELPEFPAKEKIKAYYQINTRLGLSLVRHPRNRILRIFEAIWMILYYAPMQSPRLLFKLFEKYARRVLKGESLITSMDSGITFE